MDMTIVGKNELAVELGWSRPKLDRYLETHAHFPVVERGAKGGGWKFDLEQVLAYLGERPREESENTAPAPTEEPPPLRIFDPESFEAAAWTLRPKGFPIAEESHIWCEGLSDDEVAIISELRDALPDLSNVRDFGKLVKKVLSAAARTQGEIFDCIALRIADPVTPDPMPIDDARAHYAKLFRMLGVLMDFVETILLKCRPTVWENGAATLERRNAVRTCVDGLRSGMTDDLRLQYCE
jgi:hypothetical protein